ncbi:MAG TPA: DNA-3-methyladenine glycosylase, partial [Ignavibacteria bacterium]|nr:DNA-3-methyladenine glycosylase [Ignavibacteria bacterium]
MIAKKLEEDFYLQSCLKAAKELIGKVLVRKKGRKIYSGIIVETEAYLGDKDAASHSFNGKTKRNEHMFARGGTAYVYFTYGNHYCVNAVIGKPGVAHAVLIRAAEPVEGIKLMMKNRGTDNIYKLCSGPGKLTQAMEITGNLSGASLLGDEIYITLPAAEKRHKIVKTKRIGITKNADVLYRFIDSESLFVSGVNYKRILRSQNKNKTGS